MTLNWPEDQPILDGETIILRPWRPEDAQAVFEACQDEMVQAFTSVPSPYRLTDAEAFVALGPRSGESVPTSTARSPTTKTR